MKHVITCDTTMDRGQLIGQALCTCGWSGKQWDISEPGERESYDAEARAHRIAVGAAKFMGCAMIVTGLTWLFLLLAGMIWLARWLI
jgi:hypothetical protein